MLLSLLLILGQFVWSYEDQRPQNHLDLKTFYGELHYERASKLVGTEVAWANYELIRNDFPQLKDLSNAQIDQWLLEQFAYIGSYQKRLDEIRQTPIPVQADNKKDAFRPENWRRSAILDAHSPDGKTMIGMVDVKGFGHGPETKMEIERQTLGIKMGRDIDIMRTEGHNDGLMSLGEAIAEVTRQMATQFLLEIHGVPMETVESYAIFKLPFSILKDKGTSIPAGAVLRQSHFGRFTEMPIPETILTDEHGGRQMTANWRMVDFGGVILKDPLIADLFAVTIDPQKTNAWKWGHETAMAFSRDVNPDKMAVINHINQMLAPLVKYEKDHPEFAKERQVRRKQWSRRKQKEPKNFIDAKLKQIENIAKKFFAQETKLIFAVKSLHPYANKVPLKKIEEYLATLNVLAQELFYELLGYRTDKDSLPLLLSGLSSTEYSVFRVAIKAITQRKPKEAIPILLKRMEEKSRVAMDSAMALMSYPDEVVFSVQKSPSFGEDINGLIGRTHKERQAAADETIVEVIAVGREIEAKNMILSVAKRSDAKAVEIIEAAIVRPGLTGFTLAVIAKNTALLEKLSRSKLEKALDQIDGKNAYLIYSLIHSDCGTKLSP